MRAEVIKCDTCCKEHNAEYMLPKAWIATTQTDYPGNDIEQHFCSFKCLIDWAEKSLPRDEAIEYVDPHGPLLPENEVKVNRDLSDYIGNDHWRDL